MNFPFRRTLIKKPRHQSLASSPLMELTSQSRTENFRRLWIFARKLLVVLIAWHHLQLVSVLATRIYVKYSLNVITKSTPKTSRRQQWTTRTLATSSVTKISNNLSKRRTNPLTGTPMNAFYVRNKSATPFSSRAGTLWHVKLADRESRSA